MALAFPKPEPRAQAKARTQRARQAARRRCWLVVYERDVGRCRGCRRSVKHLDDPTATEFTIGHVHEPTRRSRGGDPTNPADCVLLCPTCHRRAHRR